MEFSFPPPSRKLVIVAPLEIDDFFCDPPPRFSPLILSFSTVRGTSRSSYATNFPPSIISALGYFLMISPGRFSPSLDVLGGIFDHREDVKTFPRLGQFLELARTLLSVPGVPFPCSNSILLHIPPFCFPFRRSLNPSSPYESLTLISSPPPCHEACQILLPRSSWSGFPP